jgi:hypothetical protein
VKDDDALVEWLQQVAEKMAPKLEKSLVAQTQTGETPPKKVEEPLKTVETPPQQVVETPVASTATPEPAVEAEVSRSGGVRAFVIIPAVTGALLIGGGTLMLLQAKGIDSDLRDPSSTRYWDGNEATSIENAKAAQRQGSLFQTLGLVGIGVGVAAVATSVILALKVEPDATVAALVTPDSGALSVRVSF